MQKTITLPDEIVQIGIEDSENMFGTKHKFSTYVAHLIKKERKSNKQGK